MPKDRHTVPEERFTIDCSFCGFLTTERTYVVAMETAQRLKLRHKASDEKITIFDRLAQRGVCNTWDIDGRCIGYKEWREVPHETVPSLREMVVSKTYPGAPSGIRITVFPTRSASHPDKFSLFSSTENAYFGKLKDTFQEAAEGANKENIRMYGTPTEAIIEEAKRRERVVGTTQELYWLTVDKLKAMCRKEGLPDTGSKKELVQRLKAKYW